MAPLEALDRRTALPALATVTRLFAALHAASVTYCYWKSTEHLGDALLGDTDLDVLVDRRAGPVLAGILTAAGFKRFAATPATSYPGIEDYLALDDDTGKLVHLHLHHQLTVGEPRLKGYHLPWEAFVLSTGTLDRDAGIYVVDPHVELVLLIVRAALKLRMRDVARIGLLGPCLLGGALREFRWLARRVDHGKLRDVARTLVGDAATQLLLGMLARPPITARLLAFRRRVRPRLGAYRTYPPAEARWRRWAREWQALQRRARNRFFRAQLPVRRTLPQGGVVIALVGADGSGKSTLARELAAWLSPKVDVVSLYFGSGDGPVSLMRQPLVWLHAGGAPTIPDRPDSDAAAPGARRAQSRWRRLLRPLAPVRGLWWALAVSREKRRHLLRGRRARNAGMIVLCDRYPQSQIMGFTDGPLLAHWRHHPWWLLRALATWEVAVYESAALVPPDLVVKLHVTSHVAAQRKAETAAEALPRRVAAITALRFPPTTRVVDVDADQPFDRVLRLVKRAAWSTL